MHRAVFGILVIALTLGSLAFEVRANATVSTPRSASTLPPPPRGWPSQLPLGISDGLGDAAQFMADAPISMRYQYLAGGVNTGKGWSTWAPGGAFVRDYVFESENNGLIPVLTYYMLLQSLPANGQDESANLASNLNQPDTMRSYFQDLALLLRSAGASSTPVVLHVEPDLWGFGQQRAQGKGPSAVPAAISSTGMPELQGLPDDLRGFAQAIRRLRDAFAPNVVLGYHISTWASGTDLLRARPPDGEVERMALTTAEFYRELDADFDLIFTEFSDRDAAFKEAQYRDRGVSWWRTADHLRFARFMDIIVQTTGRRFVIWQIPVGNTRMRAMNNVWGHYQDNLVETLLDEADTQTLSRYVDIGLVGLLFGPGAGGTTCYCDANADGTTDPEPINGNLTPSYSTDDDGGYLRDRLRTYSGSGGLTLLGLPTSTESQ